MANSGTTKTSTRTGFVRLKRRTRASQRNRAVQIGFLTDYCAEIDILTVGDVKDHFFTADGDRLKAFERY